MKIQQKKEFKIKVNCYGSVSVCKAHAERQCKEEIGEDDDGKEKESVKVEKCFYIAHAPRHAYQSKRQHSVTMNW